MTAPLRVLHGIGVGSQPATGQVVKAQTERIRKPGASPQSTQAESQRLSAAIDTVAIRLRESAKDHSKEAAEILEALEFILRDNDLFEGAMALVRSGQDAASAFADAVDAVIATLDEGSELAVDIKGLADQVVGELSSLLSATTPAGLEKVVLVKTNISTVEATLLDASVVGVVTMAGSPTSHAAIICKSLGLPLLVQCKQAESLVAGEQVLLDPAGDRVVVGGTLELSTKPVRYIPKHPEPCVRVQVNVSSLDDLRTTESQLAAGVGLIRSELMFLDRFSAPTLDEQSDLYQQILLQSPVGPVVARTWDLGPDKQLLFAKLGNRNELIKTQLQALEIARSKTGRELWVMAPMVENLDQAREFAQLAKSLGDFKIGIMVERVGIVPQIESLDDDFHFISVGTNDLLQDLLGLDRLHPEHADQLSHWTPELIALMAEIAKAANNRSLHAGVCGESASDPAFAAVLAGLGFDSVSVAVSQLDTVQVALRSLTRGEAKGVAQAAVLGATADEAKSRVVSILENNAG